MGRLWWLLLGSTGTAWGQNLAVTSQIPAVNARTGPVAGDFSLIFNQTLAPTTGTLGGLRLFSSQHSGLLRQGQGATVSVNGATLTLDPTANFRSGETVFVTATNAVQASSGATLPRGQVTQFTTAVSGTGRGDFGAGPAATYPVGNGPLSVALGDVDADGDLDVLAANRMDNSVSVRLNQSNGTFGAGAAANYAVGNDPASVVLGDVDADGDLDMVAANYGSNTVSVRLNQGNGTFGSGPATDYLAGQEPVHVVLGDMDADGDLDMVIANRAGGHIVSIRLNQGNGNFGSGNAVSYPVSGSVPQSVTLGDVDADGGLDMVVAYIGSREVSVHLNQGNGTFDSASAATYFLPITPISVVLGDIDADGDLDMVAAAVGNNNNNYLSVRLNQGNGTFGANGAVDYPVGPAPAGVVLGDVDADGDLDMVAADFSSNTVSVRLNQGNGTFGSRAAASYLVGSAPAGVGMGDVDGDGDLDIVTVNRDSNDLSVRLNQSAPLATRTSRTRAVTDLYPNPARTTQHLTVTGLPIGMVVCLLDALGRPVPSVNRTTVPVAGPLRLLLPASLAPGLYLLQAGNHIQRVVVE